MGGGADLEAGEQWRGIETDTVAAALVMKNGRSGAAAGDMSR